MDGWGVRMYAWDGWDGGGGVGGEAHACEVVAPHIREVVAPAGTGEEGGTTGRGGPKGNCQASHD